MTAKIQANNLSLKYAKHRALKDLSFTLSGEKIYGLLGRNGAGKTSLLSIIASLREQTSGTITIMDEPPFENAKIMQQVVLIYNKDYKDESDKIKAALEGVARYRPHFDMEYANHLIKRFKLPLDKPIKQFSKGMQSAFNVTIGLACRAPITIFDEAYLGMDAPTREIFYQELRMAQEECPRMIILSTHLVSEMDYLFDEILMINQGELVLQEEYESFITRGASVTGDGRTVDEFVHTKKILNSQQLGNTKSVMVYGDMTETERNRAIQLGLEIGPITLQDLLIYLTEEEGHDA